MRYTVLLLMCAMVAGTMMLVMAAHAQPIDDVEDSVTTHASSEEAAVPDADAPDVVAPATAPEQGSDEDLAIQYEALLKAFNDMRTGDGGKMFLWFLLLAAGANLLISAIKRWMKLSDQGKKYLPWVAVGLGAVAGVLTYYGSGAGLLEALVLGLGPACSVLVQELIGPIHSKPATG